MGVKRFASFSETYENEEKFEKQLLVYDFIIIVILFVALLDY